MKTSIALVGRWASWGLLASFALVLLLGLVERAHGEDTLQDRLTRGIVAEETQQDLKSAAAHYSEILKIADQQRSVVASALFRLAEVQRRLGQAEESKSNYARLIREFPASTNLVEMARKYVPAVSAPPLLAPQAEQEQLLLQEIGIAEKVAEEARRKREVGAAGGDEVWKAERELLKLRREMAALRGKARVDLIAEVPSGKSAEPVKLFESDESLEIERLKKLFADSPDLINGVSLGGSTPLTQAAGKDQPLVVEYLISQGADVDGGGRPGWTPLAKAASIGNKRIVEILLKAGARVNANDPKVYGALHAAVAGGHRILAETLIKAGASLDAMQMVEINGSSRLRTPLGAAVEKGNHGIALLLAKAGADVNKRYSASNRDPSDPNSLPYVLVRAANDASWSEAEAFLALGADPNPEGMSLLFWCARAPSSLWNKLFEKGCQVDSRGVTRCPLYVAVEQVVPEFAGWLVAHGAGKSPEAYTVSSALISAINQMTRFGEPPRTQFLGLIDKVLEQSVSLEVADSEGETPLAVAVRTGNYDVAERLLAKGASPKVKASGGYSLCATIVNRQDQQFSFRGIPSDVGFRKRPDAAAARAMINRLLDAGANPNDGTGPLTLLEYVVLMEPDRELVKVIISHKPDVNLRGQDGYTPLETVRRQLAKLVEPGNASVRTELREIRELLMAAGAREDAPDFDSIRLSSSSRDQVDAVIKKLSENDVNRYTLLEFLAIHYGILSAPPGSNPFAVEERNGGVSPGRLASPPGQFPGRPPGNVTTPITFPDWEHLVIWRYFDQAGKIERRRVSLDMPGLLAGDVTTDPLLAWGDVVEIPVKDHALNAVAPRLPSELRKPFEKFLNRKIMVRIDDGAEYVTLKVTIPEDGPRGGPSNSRFCFTLPEALQLSGLLRSSSDRTRIRVIQTYGETRVERLIDLDAPKGGTDVWLRDGAIIDVPDKKASEKKIPERKDGTGTAVIFGGLKGVVTLERGKPVRISTAVQAQNPSELLNLSKIKLHRKGEGDREQVLVFNMKRFLQEGVGEDIELKDGDRIEVRENTFSF
ncbi:MAG TPA: ankyrin repeat domain-containing protein [Candidatus Limnocylindria bacterium]|nr:ankyrin repeat domain-containing protein [Candidatus Limnocylindria bacterium]